MPVPSEGLLCKSSVSTLDFLEPHTQEEIRHEPAFFGASVAFARERGGPIMQDFLDKLPDIFGEGGVIDSRSHMLMPGWFPCIPGWHHDDVPRPPVPVGQHFAAGGQPDYVNPAYRSRHVMVLVGAAVAPTQFARGTIHLPHVPDGEVIYRHWHNVVDEAVASGALRVREAQEGELLSFNDRSLHQGVPARFSGWRHFIRISFGSDRKPVNELRGQTQVYLPAPMAGW